jgi:chromosome segregation ATPase
MGSPGGESSGSNPSAELAELRAHNRALEKQIAGLNGELQRTREAIQDMRATQESSGGNSPAIQELRTINERLEMELTQLRSRLASSEADLSPSAAAHDASEMQIQSQAELKAAHEKLHESATRIRQLEETDLRHREERENLAAHITDLEKKLSATEQSVSEMDHLRARSQRAEHEQQELLEQIRQRELELAQWQSRASEAEQHRQRLAALQTPYHALVSKQAALSEQQRELQADLEAFAKLMDHRQG